MQEDIITSVLAGKDTLALLPTGGGKSVCFQVPAMCLSGVCIVVSPLIALMKDQVANLRKKGIVAEAIFSGVHYRDIDRILDNCVYGNVKFLYVSPERLQNKLLQARLQRMTVCLLAIDEAHCISQWGYDFRPPYLQVSETRALLPNVPVLALTATATPEVVQDIREKLAFHKQRQATFQQSFARSNLAYVVLYTPTKLEKCIDILKKMPASSVIYTRNRKQTLSVAQTLQQYGISATHYHAGLTAKERSEAQENWINNKVRVIVATNAFGMGIDKPDVQTVIHLDVPETLEAYFQEAGRAGRNGEKAYPILLYHEKDKEKLRTQFEISFPPLAEVRRVYQALGNYFQLAVGSGEQETFDFEVVAFAKQYEMEVIKAFHALKLLESAGWIALSDSVFKAAKLQIIVDKQTWYNAVLKNPRHETLMMILMRAYDNVWHQPVDIEVEKLANQLKIPIAHVKQQLQYLTQQELIFFEDTKDAPQLTFTRERVTLENLNFTEALYEFRKKRHEEKMEAIIAYCETDACRTLQLINYFGEQNETPCGVCDSCLNQKKQARQHDEYLALKNRLQHLITTQEITANTLLAQFSSLQTNDVLRILDHYFKEQQVIETENGTLQWV